MTNQQQHWEAVYNTKSSDSVSWYQPHADRSLQLIQATGLGPQAKVIDVGQQDVTGMDFSAAVLLAHA